MYPTGNLARLRAEVAHQFAGCFNLLRHRRTGLPQCFGRIAHLAIGIADQARPLLQCDERFALLVRLRVDEIEHTGDIDNFVPDFCSGSRQPVHFFQMRACRLIHHVTSFASYLERRARLETFTFY